MPTCNGPSEKRTPTRGSIPSSRSWASGRIRDGQPGHGVWLHRAILMARVLKQRQFLLIGVENRVICGPAEETAGGRRADAGGAGGAGGANGRGIRDLEQGISSPRWETVVA